jgi:lysophospholipase L1-like esterase
VRPFRLQLLALALISTTALAAKPINDTHWVGSWATSPYALPNTEGHFAEPTTLRQTVHVSVGGASFRVALSNEFGTDPLAIGGASVSLSAAAAPIALSFHGQPGATVPAGAAIVSDPVAMTLPALSDLTINLYLPAQTLKTITYHGFADATGYEAKGNQITATDLRGAKKVYNWRFLKTVEVTTGKAPAAIVALGDSITDGAHSSRDANARWPDVLARRLQADPKTRGLGVLNEGIGGNRMLHDGTGPNAIARFDRDVLAQPGVKYVVLMESINDIGHAAQLDHPNDIVTAQELITGMKQLIVRAHTHGLKIYGATLTPYEGAAYASPAGEVMREAVNGFIRSGGSAGGPGNFDGVIDFDKAVRDPLHPTAFLPLYDCGDHLHPSDAGYKAMGDAIDLKLFLR